MKYLKLYESFTLPKYENDYKKIVSYKEEIKKKKSELWDMNTELNQMEIKMDNDHNLTKMLNSIFNKISEYLENNNLWVLEEDVDILEYIEKSKDILTGGSNLKCYIDVDEGDDNPKSKLIEEVVKYDEEWCFKTYDDYGDPFYSNFNDQYTITLYEIIKVLMSDNGVIEMINSKAFKSFNDINEGFVNKVLITTLLGIGALRGYPQSDTLVNKQIEQKIEMIDTDVNINDTINFIDSNEIVLGQKYEMSLLDEQFYTQFNRNLKGALTSLTKSASPISVQVFTFDNESAGLVKVPIINIDLYLMENLKISFFDSGWGDNYYNVFGFGITKKF